MTHFSISGFLLGFCAGACLLALERVILWCVEHNYSTPAAKPQPTPEDEAAAFLAVTHKSRTAKRAEDYVRTGTPVLEAINRAFLEVRDEDRTRASGI